MHAFVLNAEPPAVDRRLLQKSLAGELGFTDFDPEAVDVLSHDSSYL